MPNCLCIIYLEVYLFPVDLGCHLCCLPGFHICGSVSGFFNLFHWTVCLSLYEYYTVLIIVVFRNKSSYLLGQDSPPFVMAELGSLLFHINLIISLSSLLFLSFLQLYQVTCTKTAHF